MHARASRWLPTWLLTINNLQPTHACNNGLPCARKNTEAKTTQGRYTLMACVRERHSGQRSIRCAHSQQVHMCPHAAKTAADGCSRQMAHRFSSLLETQTRACASCISASAVSFKPARCDHLHSGHAHVSSRSCAEARPAHLSPLSVPFPAMAPSAMTTPPPLRRASSSRLFASSTRCLQPGNSMLGGCNV